jgi:hypothetical protein
MPEKIGLEGESSLFEDEDKPDNTQEGGGDRIALADRKNVPQEILEDGEPITPDTIEDNYNKAIAEKEKDPDATPEGTSAFEGILGRAKDYLMKTTKDHPGALMVAGGLLCLVGSNISVPAMFAGTSEALSGGISAIGGETLISILLGQGVFSLGEDIFKKGSGFWKEKHGQPLFSLSLLGHDYNI